jgi:hypothetical protein
MRCKQLIKLVVDKMHSSEVRNYEVALHALLVDHISYHHHYVYNLGLLKPAVINKRVVLKM